ncbi:MAG TPA: aldo/keto reductase [Polyangiaceae bacterium]|nr:aldo/keto reductase [Polyangiaceae bacterium]
MQYRPLGRTGFDVSVVGFGAWAIGGGSWGPTDDATSMATLHRALDRGVNLFDTADVYGDGHSERLIARLRRERSERFYVATKVGRRSNPHVASAYRKATLAPYVERCLRNLEVESLDLVQLHCPPTDVYYMPEVFDGLDELAREGKIRYYGVSVERVEEALKAIEYPNVQSVQIIFNVFRQRPLELFFPEALRRRVGILARLPLSSGLLGGKMRRDTAFAPGDHRRENREGQLFDKGETFSGIPYELGLELVEELRALVPPGRTLAELALAWILGHEAVTTVIPGGRRPEQVEENAKAADFPPLSPETRQKLTELYEQRVRPLVHHRW